jgi:hypothetical protein
MAARPKLFRWLPAAGGRARGLAQLLWAHGVHSSRCFSAAQLGLAAGSGATCMVPWFDLANHRQDHPVVLGADVEVIIPTPCIFM